MRASILLTSFIAGLGAAQSIVDPVNYDILNDPFHEELRNISLASNQESQLGARAAERHFRLSTGAIIVAGYTFVYGGSQMKQVYDACLEVQGGAVSTGGDCIKASAELLSAYAILGVAGYTGQTACIGLLTGDKGLANTVSGDQGQGSNVKRAAIDPPPFQYGVSNISDSMIDLMNHAAAVGQQQQKVTKPNPALRQSCSNNNANLFRDSHFFLYSGNNGMKLQCKPGCGQGGWNGRDMTITLDRLASTLMLHNDMNAQFTVYNNNNGRVYARCKMVFLTGASDTCPEFITGQGCNF
ncbi:hypothetical protein NW768_011717 [Fusarium equiseti]|uniref:Uncharacterized protein n=1 Tax=Fusarium equiseti TaxID=61235 RepID=A0ABQ8QWM4_FUSEQ|nr:hypothetical protein NW768_011717 [Fusarium equiseti]